MGAGGGRRLSLEEFSAPCCGIRFSLAQRLALDAGGFAKVFATGCEGIERLLSLGTKQPRFQRISDLGRNRFKSCLAGNNVGIQRK